MRTGVPWWQEHSVAEACLVGALGWGLTSDLPSSGRSRADEECGDERARHREERLLGARLDRDQEKLLR